MEILFILMMGVFVYIVYTNYVGKIVCGDDLQVGRIDK